MLKKLILATVLLGTSLVAQADVLCPPDSVTGIMVKANGDIIYYDWNNIRHLAFKAREMSPHLASVMMIALNEAMVMRPKNDIYIQSSYPDGYDCKTDDLITAPLRIFFDQTRAKG
jgi:hypothetical protein